MAVHAAVGSSGLYVIQLRTFVGDEFSRTDVLLLFGMVGQRLFGILLYTESKGNCAFYHKFMTCLFVVTLVFVAASVRKLHKGLRGT